MWPRAWRSSPAPSCIRSAKTHRPGVTWRSATARAVVCWAFQVRAHRARLCAPSACAGVPGGGDRGRDQSANGQRRRGGGGTRQARSHDHAGHPDAAPDLPPLRQIDAYPAWQCMQQVRFLTTATLMCPVTFFPTGHHATTNQWLHLCATPAHAGACSAPRPRYPRLPRVHALPAGGSAG